MNDVEKRARELLAAEYERRGSRTYAESLRVTPLWAFGDDESAMGIRAIIAALTSPDGFVLVPVEPTDEMLSTGYGWMMGPSVMRKLWTQLLAARPEVK